MIFILHYILFNATLPASTVLLALYLQTYSETNMTEIGTLLMVLPFITIIVKPLFCAMADRHQAHKYYLAGTYLVQIIGYGSLAVPAFFPTFYKEQGRLVWYMFIVMVVIGYSAMGVIFSLGDALAVNAARRRNVPWGAYRAWATFSWGASGFIVGQINELWFLPKYTPALFLLVLASTVEIILLLLWPNKDFDMNELEQTGGDMTPTNELDTNAQPQPPAKEHGFADLDLNEHNWPHNQSQKGTLNAGSARINPRLVSAMASIFAEDIGNTLKSSLRIGNAPKRGGLDDLLQQHQLKQAVASDGSGASALAAAAPNNNNSVIDMNNAQQQQQLQTTLPASANNGQLPLHVSPSSPTGVNSAGQFDASKSMSLSKGSSPMAKVIQPNLAGATLTKQMLLRTQRALSRMNSLSSASGQAIIDATNSTTTTTGADFAAGDDLKSNPVNAHHQRPMVMSSLASNASLSRAAAARALGFSNGSANSNASQNNISKLASGDLSTTISNNDSSLSGNIKKQQLSVTTSTLNASSRKEIEDLQLVLLKLIVKRDSNIIKYIIIFTIFGILLFIHLNFFLLHVEYLCSQKGYNFSNVFGSMIVAQSISEIFCFLVIVPVYMPRVGRIGSLITCTFIFAIRYLYYGTYYQYYSPYTALPTEFCHGFAYGITYTLITDVALDCVNQVDDYLPELIARKIVDPNIDSNILKLPLRATMQGVFSGAFDGLGAGLGALIAGIYLDNSTYTSLWLTCAVGSIVCAIVYPLTEWKALCRSRRDNKNKSVKR